MTEIARRLLLGASLACAAGAALPGCTHRGVTKPPVVTPTPPPVDPAALPPKGVPARLDLLLRPAPGGKLKLEAPPVWQNASETYDRATGTVRIFMAIQCCGGGGAILSSPDANTRWPCASEEWMDRTHAYGANAWHCRLGPFFGDAENESEWADIGGPIKADGSWNEAFFAKLRALVWHAAKLNGFVEVNPIDTWYCKHAASNWGDQKMPWPQADIDACGITWTPTHEAMVRKTVAEIGPFGNVIWLVDNEGGEIKGARRAWFEAAHAAIRRAEQEVGAGVVHMVGTNWPDIADGPFDYVATHARAPLTEPIAGKWTINNEHNPAFLPDQEAAYFAQAREKGLGWALWLANLQGADVVRAFEKFRDVVKGGPAQTGCFAPPEDDPRWQPGPVKGCPDALLAALATAKGAIGDPRPAWRACQADRSKPEEERTPIACMFPALDSVAEGLRAQGWCAGRTRDAVTAKADDKSTTWYEMHVTGATDGGWAGSPCKGSTWTYPQ